MGLIYWARPAQLYYANTAADAARIGFDDALIYRELAKPPQQRSLNMKQIMHEEALAAFLEWEKKPNKTPY
jgi:tRNA(Arg) A34 adenosine deaminase TadA